jgi:hemoglobin-like flavoprotein
MTPDEVKIVQNSFAKVVPIADHASIIFYDRLFEIAPMVRSMFPDDLKEQRKKLMATLAIIVRGLDDLPSILPAASALAKRPVKLSRGRLGASLYAAWASAKIGLLERRRHGPRPMARFRAS